MTRRRLIQENLHHLYANDLVWAIEQDLLHPEDRKAAMPKLTLRDGEVLNYVASYTSEPTNAQIAAALGLSEEELVTIYGDERIENEVQDDGAVHIDPDVIDVEVVEE